MNKLINIIVLSAIIGVTISLAYFLFVNKSNKKYATYKVTHYYGNDSGEIYYVKEKPYWPVDQTYLKLKLDNGNTITISGNIKIEQQ